MEIEYTKSIPVRYEAEVCIAGGGPAGVAAAVTAAEAGADVLLLEGQGCFGGAASHAFVPAFMQFTDGENFLAGGFGRKVHDYCEEEPWLAYPSYVGINLERLKRFYDACMEKSGAKYLFFTQLVDVAAGDGCVQHAIFSGKNGLFAVKAGLFIDATGDGDLCAMAGGKWQMGDENGATMPATLVSIWHNIDWDTAPHPQNSKLEQALADGVFSQVDRHLSGIFRTGVDTGGANAGHAFACNGLDVEDLTRAMVDGRRMLPEFETYYNSYLGGGFAKASPLLTAPMLGVRETRRITGLYTFTMQDYKARAGFEDEIGRYAYPIDIHPADGSPEAYQNFLRETVELAYTPGESYGIPYRCLVPAGLRNVLVAGRCISADKMAQSTLRVMPACFITGQAVGMAAALCLQTKTAPAALDAGLLREKLRGVGAFLP